MAGSTMFFFSCCYSVFLQLYTAIAGSSNSCSDTIATCTLAHPKQDVLAVSNGEIRQGLGTPFLRFRRGSRRMQYTKLLAAIRISIRS